MGLQAVIVERLILSILITIVAAIATSPIGSSINGLSRIKSITPLAELEGVASNRPVDPTDYTLSIHHGPSINRLLILIK
ncbi:MAG: hypothetical protein WBA13_10300 [Microcoleaceae cyanobacterium]